jgi:periplasmic protein TonB
VAKDINLNSKEWCDLVFEGKNHSYGAYNMRETSTKRHIVAFVIGILFVAFVAFLPTLIETVKSLAPKERMTDVTELSNLKMDEQKLKEQDIIHKEEAPPPVPLRSTIKFTAPVITDAADVKEEDEMKSQEDLQQSQKTVSIKDIVGTDDEHGVDIADLQQHKVAVQEEKPLYGVEQMPEFPGGEAEMIKFISDNLHYPASATEMGIEGRVTIRFVVTKTGEVTDVEVLRGLDPACDREAMRVVKLMPKWIPGRQNGRNVPVYFTLPVMYKIQR